MEEQNVRQLVLDAKSGSQIAIAGLYQQYKKPMYGICLRMLAVKDDAEDALQEAFIQAFHKLGSLKTEEAFGGWLRRIVINECTRYSKKKFAWLELENLEHEVESEAGESEDWFSGIELSRIHHEIKKLPEGYRQVFNLFAIEEFSHKEIAEQLGITESTSKSQYYKAKARLKKQLTGK